MRKQILTAAVIAACAGMSVAAQADDATKIGGKAYIDFTSLNDKDSTGTKTDKSGLGFDVKRFYVGVDHKFDDMYSANITTDFANDNAAGIGKTQVFVKKAYLQAKFSDAAVVRVGSADMPWIPFVEGIYGYRYIENTMTDKLHLANSADWGAHLGGKAMDGMINYAVSAVNGNGYGTYARSKSLDFAGRIGVMPVKGLTLALGMYSGKRGKDVESATGLNKNTRYDFLAAYKQDMFTVGGEFVSAKNNDPTAAKDKATGYSVFGTVKAGGSMAVFARYDNVKPNKDTAPSMKDTYYNVGVSYQARKNVDLALAYKNNKVANTGGDAKTTEIGVWTQVKF